MEVVCAGRGAAATAAKNSGGIGKLRVGRRDAGAPAQPAAIARGARSECFRRHRQSLLPRFCVEVGGLVRELGKWEEEKATATAAKFEETENPTRGGMEARGRKATRTGQTEGAKREGAATMSPERQERCAQLPSSTVGRLQPNGEQ